MLEGLKPADGEDEDEANGGGGGLGEESTESNGGGADKNIMNGEAASLAHLDRLPAFSPRKNQALRNTFGFIAPGGITLSRFPSPLFLPLSPRGVGLGPTQIAPDGV
jgi:hypothetical protein